MKTSAAGIDLIRAYEGLRLTAYRDSVGTWTIGYGSTRAVMPGTIITPEQAEVRLLDDVAIAEDCVNKCVTVPLTQGQFDALVSFTFNLGCRALHHSTLLIKLNAGDRDGASNELLKWDHAAGQVLPGLLARREAEKELFTA
jgi:lysozyme